MGDVLVSKIWVLNEMFKGDFLGVIGLFLHDLMSLWFAFV
jgi:hypothetical protein